MNEPNVILITIDGLRRDHLHCYGYSRMTSPTIDKLASNGVIFRNAFSHGGGSPEAFPSLHAAVMPPTSSDQYGRLFELNSTIAEMLRSKGYSTAAFVDSNAFLSKYFNYDKGFDYFYDGISDKNESTSRLNEIIDNSKLAKRVGIGSPEIELLMRKRPVTTADELNRKAISWLRAQKGRKFFTWIHYMDTHQPFLPSRENQKEIGVKPMNYYGMLFLQRKAKGGINRMNNAELQKFVNLYDALIRYDDAAVSGLLAELKAQGVLDNTLIIITADHGTNLGEEGLMRHGSLYESVIRIPLIFKGPGIKSSSFDLPVTTIGVRDTIINLVNGSTQGDATTFAPLRQSIDSSGGIISTMVDIIHNVRMISYRTNKWKYIRTDDLVPGSTTSELYDLETDPLETADVLADHGKEYTTFENIVQNFVRDSALRFQEATQQAYLY
jgi:arylsulfatase A-like enzyme